MHHALSCTPRPRPRQHGSICARWQNTIGLLTATIFTIGFTPLQTVFVRRCVVYASEPRKSLRLHDEDDWRCEAVSPTFPKGRRVKWDYGSGRILLPILSPSFSGMLQAFSEKPKCTKSFLKANMLSVLEVTFVILVLSITVFEFRFKRKRSLVSINGNTSEGSIDRFRYSTVRPE